MKLKNKNIQFILTGSLYAFPMAIDALKAIFLNNANIFPLMSEKAYSMNNKSGKTSDYIKQIKDITCKEKIIHQMNDLEVLPCKKNFDIIVLAPATGDTIAKLANGITDSVVTTAVKLHLKNDKPVVIAIAAHDALSSNAENIGKLLNRKNYYFVPFSQDNPITKPHSLIFNANSFIRTIELALDGKQIQPILV